MKRFSERSKRGQRRLLICAGMLFSIFLVFFIDILNTSIFSEMGLGQGEDVSSTKPNATPTVTVSPTKPSDFTIETSLEWLYDLVLNPVYSYNSLYGGVSLDESAFDKIIDTKSLPGETISIDAVGIGDIAVCGSYVGICVGQYDGALLFAYISPMASNILPAGGVYLGYSVDQKDAALYGMLPIPFEKYYDVSSIELDAIDVCLVEKLWLAAKQMDWYEDLLYSYSRKMSSYSVQELINSFPSNLLVSTHLNVDEDEFRGFLEQFPLYSDSNFYDYCFTVTDEVAFDEYSVLTVACVSMEPENLFETGGRWEVSIFYSDAFIPCVAPQIEKYMGVCGFIPAAKNDLPVLERTEEELIRDEEMNKAGFELHHDGTYIYYGDGYRIVIDPENPEVPEEEMTVTEEILTEDIE